MTPSHIICEEQPQAVAEVDLGERTYCMFAQFVYMLLTTTYRINQSSSQSDRFQHFQFYF